MDRKLYLEACQKVSALRSGVFGIKQDIPKKLLVTFEGRVYYPESYLLSFRDGKPIHIAVVHDLKANSVFQVGLDNLEFLEYNKER